jgi:hypothetical protein
MRFLKNILLAITLFSFLPACKSGADKDQKLTAADARKANKDTIADDGAISKGTMESMMNSEDSKIRIEGNEKMASGMMKDHTAMMKMMKENPAMMESMMKDMMETCKQDTAMMSLMFRTMMKNPQMKEMMRKEMGK